MTMPTGFDITFTNVEATFKQRRDKVISTLLQRCSNVEYRRCINVVQRWKSDVGFCFIFNVGSALFQRWSTTLKQHLSYVKMLAGMRHPIAPLLLYFYNSVEKDEEFVKILIEANKITYIMNFSSCFIFFLKSMNVW